MKNDNKLIFYRGMKRFFPISFGVLPFGLIVGTIASNNGLNTLETFFFNFFIFAGASELAAFELLSKNAPIFIIVLTCVVINLRFIIYSASLAPMVSKLNFFQKIICAYLITDQSYALVVSESDKLKNNSEKLAFYLGASFLMLIVWDLSVIAGAVFGNIAPKSWELDFIIPIAFMSLVIPNLKNRRLVYVAIFSSVMSVVTYYIPYNLGLLITAFSALTFAAFLEKLNLKRTSHES